MKSPRIYLYKITFEEIPDWYWGIHKEKKFGEEYLGSPVTHAWKWNFYTPKKQILQFFPYTGEGWKEANLVEDRVIFPDLNNPFCLNESCGAFISLESSKKGGKKGAEVTNAEKDENGKSKNAVKGGRASAATTTPEQKSERGRRGAESTAKVLTQEDRIKNGRKGAEASHRDKDENGKSKQGVKNGERLHKDKEEGGKSKNAVKGGKRGGKTSSAQKWMDPEHPELGIKNAGPLVCKQKARGYPHGKENRVRIS